MLKSIFVTADKTYTINDDNLNKMHVFELKKVIHNKTNIKPKFQILRHGGSLMNNHKYVSDYPIQNGGFIDLGVKIMGGKKTDKKKLKKKAKKLNKKDKKSNKDITIEKFPDLGDIGDAFAGPFEDFGDMIVKAFQPVIDFFIMIYKVVLWLFDVIIWLFTDLLNPLVWINDVIMGAFVGLQLLGLGLLDAVFAILRKVFNVAFKPVARGVWGDEFKHRDKSKCYKMPDCSVPYPVLIATIILPPLGVFMELGLKGWLNIFLCAALTLVYYVPGLVYALILLYC